MSSMFKKRGGLAFKPKIPSARPRQPTAPAAAAAAAPQRAKTVDSQIAPEAPQEEDRRDDAAEVPDSEKVSGGAADSETIHPAPAGQPSPTPTPTPAPAPSPTQHAVSKAPSIHTQPELSVEASIEEPTTNIAQASKPKDVASGSQQIRPEPTFQEREPQPPIIHTRTETSTPEVSQTVEESPPADVPVAATSQEKTSQSDETPAPAPEAPAPRTRSKRPSAPRAKKGPEDETAAARPKKRQRKSPQNEETESEPATTTKTTRRRRQTESADGEVRSKRRARSLTPEDAENQVVDLQNLKMADLTRDLHIGKKFSRHDELRDRERQKRIKAKMKRDGELVEEEETESGAQTPARSNGARSESAAPAAPAAGPQFRIVDGQIVLDQSSLVMDRHARAAAAQGDMETIEENDFTRLITSNSFMNTSKLKGPNIWTADETELFYRGLRMFGTDFEMISKMFAGKQRRHIKLKFNREERHNPRMIDAALIGEKTIKMDIDEYKAVTGSEFETVEAIEADHRRIEEEFEAERKRVADEEAEAMRKKREALFADDDGNVNDADVLGRKKKKGKKKGKNANPDMYGEVVAME